MHLADADRDMDQWIPVTPTGFEQENRNCGVLGQAGGERAARRSRADDDVVVTFWRH